MVTEESTQYPGIRVRNNIIWIDFRYKGCRCRESSGLALSKSNLEIAHQKRCAIKYEIALGKFNYADHFPNSNNVQRFGGNPASNMTINEAIDWWWKDNMPTDESTKRDHKTNINKHIKPGIGNILLRDLKVKQVKVWIQNVNLSPSSKNNILAPLRKMFQTAYNEELIENNIMIKVPTFKRAKKAKNPLNIYESDAIINYMKTIESKAFYEFAIWTGLSTGEQLGLKWGDVDFKRYNIRIVRILTDRGEKPPKNEFRKRKVELLSPSYNALNELRPRDYFDNEKKYKDEYVFKNPNTGAVWTSGAIALRWNNALKDLEIPYRTPYETRHTFASIMVTACLPDGWVRRQMGHSKMEMLENVYAKWLDDPDKIIDWILKHTVGGKNGPQFTKHFLERHTTRKN